VREQSAQARVRPSPETSHREGPSEATGPAPYAREAITSPEHIRAILATATVLGRPGLLRQGHRTSRIQLLKLDAEAGRLRWRCEARDAEWNPLPATLEVQGHDCVYRLQLSRGLREAGHWVTPLPSQLERVRHRAHRRVPAPAAWRVQLPLPGWHGQAREVVDLSWSGLALKLAPGERLVPGRVLLPVQLHTGNGRPLSLRGEVRHVTERPDGTSVCGLRVEPLTSTDGERWREWLTQALHPTTRADGALAEGLWQLFIESGYFNLAGRSAAWFEARRTSFLELARRVARFPEVLLEAVWPSERGVEATFSAMKPYRSLWLVHQLARRQGGSRFERVPGQMLRDLYARAVEHARCDPGFRWMAAYIESTVPFVNRAHMGFLERVAGTGQGLLLPVRMIDVACDAPDAPGTPGLEVGPATAEERGLLCEEIARTRPAAYVEALDLGPDALDLEDAARPWHARGLERERQVLVARQGHTPLAAAVLEVGPPGTNPFRLLDATRLFPLSPGGREAYPALMDAARRWYASHGRDGFIFLSEQDGDVEAAGLHDEAPEAKPYLWLIPADLAPDFVEHLHEQTVSRLPPIHREGAVMSLMKTQYLPHVLETRARLDTEPVVRALLAPDIAPALLERFLIEWSARGAYMTEPVEGWIRGAGERCIALGQTKLGNALVTHARHEAGHHLMTIEDARVLVGRWNARRAQPLDADALVAQPPTEAMRQYRQVHDEAITGDLPLGQAAIEYEVGYLAVVLVPRILAHVKKVLGQDTLDKLTFLKEHAEVDVGHTALNERMMEELLRARPEAAPSLAAFGIRGLDCYLRFLADCLARAQDALAPLNAAA
jgi:hypothetical protein